ncbi:hypothetical protein GALMADRAFT_73731 [Galerina marginata CBS 339.88]|uniref:Uncharacterized protein n=1 Tax=Galerina marginata (strain CBS 339.88) TaxID=685588 RepID=A0A067T0F2_GALM3|nr:hypothetical protein GALMADRAFT_73731 [Galerina marginata CBS 339.88]
MVNPGAFLGLRRAFMIDAKPAYSEGVKGGFAADALAIIQRGYFKRFPVDLPHEEEPTAESLAAVDDEAPEPDRMAPDEDALGEEEYAAALQEVEVRRKTFVYRKAQIKRWHAHQYMKDNDMDPKDSGLSNPYRILLHRLTGTCIARPRMRSSTNTWRRTQAPLREGVAREMFYALPEEERDEWANQAQADHDAALEVWTTETQADPSKEPADRQRCIETLVGFAQPFLDLICEATGWKATLIAGGPEPAHEGRLNVISLHSGTMTGDVKMNFGRAERVRYKSVILPVYGSFLRKCYCEFCSILLFGLSSNTIIQLLRSAASKASLRWISKPTARISTPLGFQAPPPPDLRPWHASKLLTNHQPPPAHPRSPPSRPPLQRVRDTHTKPTQAAETRTTATKATAGAGTQATAGAGTVTAASVASSTGLGEGGGDNDSGSQTRGQRWDASKTKRRQQQQPNLLLFVSLPSSSSSPCTGAPSTAPKWFRSALSMLQVDSGGLGPRWMELVALWVDFEAKEAYEERSKLSATGRPVVVKDWIQRARSPTWRPVIKDLAKFEREFGAKPGVNGLLSLLATLFFWGLHVRDSDVDRARWTTVVDNCLAAVTQVVRIAE